MTSHHPSFLPFELIEIIASFADAATLAALDLTCLEMRQRTHNGWAACALARFAMGRSAGKDAWRAGVALETDPDYSIAGDHQQQEQQQHYVTTLGHSPPEYGDAFSGSTMIAQNESIVVFCSDQHDHDIGTEDGTNSRILEMPIQVRDAKTLEIKYHFESEASVWNVAICGPVGRESIIIATRNSVIVFQGDFHQHAVTIYKARSPVNDIVLLGKADTLIVLTEETLFVYQPCHSVGPDELSLELTFQIPIKFRSGTFQGEAAPAWSADLTQFGYSPTGNQLLLWNLYDTSLSSLGGCRQINPSRLQELKMASNANETSCNSLAFNDEFIAVSLSSANDLEGFEAYIVVIDRLTGSRLYNLPDAIGTTGFFDEEIPYYTPTVDLVISGCYLVASSVKGCALVVWDLRTGKVSYRKRTQTLAAHGWGYTSKMVQLSAWSCHAFVTTTPTGQMALWGFPQSNADQKCLETISVREATQEAAEKHLAAGIEKDESASSSAFEDVDGSMNGGS